MPTDQLQISERLVFDGVVGVATAATLAVLLAVATAWLMWRERKVLGTLWALVFWVLRMGALGVALWMLAGPMQEKSERLTKPQSIAILADGSNSMETVDPVEASDALRWALATQNTDEPSPVTLCDRAQVAMGAARQSCVRFRDQLAEHRPPEQLKTTVAEIRVAVDRATRHCETLGNQLGGHDDLVERVSRVETMLAGPVAESLETLRESFESRDQSTGNELAAQWESLSEGVNGACRRLQSLSRDVALTWSESFDGPSGSADLTRREKTGLALDSLEKELLADMHKDVRIQRYLFDDKLAAVPEAEPWADALKSVSWQAEEPSDIEEAPSASGSMPTTNLAAVLQQLGKSRASDATRFALVLSDGRHNALDATAPQEVAAGLANLPVYVVPVGSSETVRDIRLHRVEAPSAVIHHDSAMIEAIVTAAECDGLSTEVVLRHDGKEVERKLLDFGGDRIDRRVQFEIHCDELGYQEYEIEVDQVDDEANTANNVSPVSLEVVRDKLRVLLCDGISQWEYRYLQQLFRRDRHIEFDELLFYPRVRGTGELALRPRLPNTVDDWAVYDVVILGDVGARQFNTKSQQALVDYVRRRQGHLILIAGRDHMPQEYIDQPLMDLLPVERNEDARLAEPHGVALTDEGRLHSALAIEDSSQSSELSWQNSYLRQPLHGLSVYSRPKETARTLIHAVPITEFDSLDLRESLAGKPAFLCWQRVGSGRVVYLSAPQTYLLRFRRGDRMHHRFWGQMIRWITAEQTGSGSEMVRLTTDQNRYKINEPVEITVWLKDQTGRPVSDQSLEVVARTLDKVAATLTLDSDEEVAGRYFAKLEGLTPGTFEIVLQGAAVDELAATEEAKSQLRTLVTVESGDDVEMLDTSTNRALLEQIAEMTGGQTMPPTAMSELLELASLSPEVTETVQRSPLWNRWTNLWIVIGCLTVEWVVRKHKGLV
jgi:hypothetical protein